MVRWGPHGSHHRQVAQEVPPCPWEVSVGMGLSRGSSGLVSGPGHPLVSWAFGGLRGSGETY